MKNLLLQKDYHKHWNLRFAENLDVDLDSIMSKDALKIINTLFDTYPMNKNKYFAFVNNVLEGNKIFNLMINNLLEEDRIQSRCLRIGTFNYWDVDLPSSRIDAVMFDNLELSLFSDAQKHALIQFVDVLYQQAGFIFFNIPTLQDLNAIPNSLRQLISKTSIKLLTTL